MMLLLYAKIYSSIIIISLLYLSGRIPIDPRLSQCSEEGNSYVGSFTGAPAQTVLTAIVVKIIEELKGDKGIHDTNRTQ